MQVNSTFSDHLRSTTAGDRIWQQERTILEATERICELMEKQDVTRTQLAALVGKSKGRISQLLDGSANMTLRTLSDIYFALGQAVHITDQPLLQKQTVAVVAGEQVQKFPAHASRWDVFLTECVKEQSTFQLAG